MRVLFIEPPKDFWFIMGKYIPPPFGILSLASYLEAQTQTIEIKVVDCQAEKEDWRGLEKRIEAFQPDIVAPSSLATCNAYIVLRTVEMAKKLDQNITTVVGGQHFTALAHESLQKYPHIDIVVRGEGEQTFVELVRSLQKKEQLSHVEGISFRHKNTIIHTPDRPLIHDLDSTPLPGYHFVEEHMKKYYFALMAEKNLPFAIIEGSRGCHHNCSYCSQWCFWRRKHRAKSPERIASELEQINQKYGSKFFWLTDDNFEFSLRTSTLYDEILNRKISDDVTWFCQARCDDIVRHKDLLPKIRRAGNTWMLIGFDSPNPETLAAFRRKGITRSKVKEAVNLLRRHDILSQGTFIIGNRVDSHESIEALQEYADWVDPDIATFMALTPFPGTEIYEEAKKNGWIEDTNWNHYDMIHAVLPTEKLTREEVQEELYECYRAFFGKWKRQYKGLFSKNPITRRTYQYLAREAILTRLRNLF